MPYTSYHLISREDSDALYAYLMSLEPIARPSPKTELAFPFNLRFGLSFWNMLYKNRVQLEPADGKSEQWKRGQYLVDVLGHCGECHTPRNALGALQQEQRLEGGVILGYLAPSLKADAMAARGWSTEDLATFLRHGVSAQGTVFNEMYPVLHHSLQYLPEVDHKAMAVFLMGDQPPAPAVIATRPLAELSPSAQAGRQDYLNVCAGCHGAEGQGIPHAAVAMAGNTTLRQADSRNLLRVIDDGIRAGSFVDLPARLLSKPFFGALNWATVWYSQRRLQSEEAIDDIAHTLAAYALRGLLKDSNDEAARATPLFQYHLG